MASIGQLELWHANSRERVEKYKALVKEETLKKKEFGRPKTPQQIQAKEEIVKNLLRYQEEYDFSKKKEREWEEQLKEARKEEKNSVPKSVKSVSKALSKKFSKSAVHVENLHKKASVKTKAADNRIQLPLLKQDVSLAEVVELVQELMVKIKIMEVQIIKLQEKASHS
jgi:signal recognition particle GTPase